MQPDRPLLTATLIVALLAGCETTVSTGSPGSPEPTAAPAGTNPGTEQLRASQRWALQSAGVPEACIQQLPASTLAEVKGITSRSSNNSREWLQRRQRIRTAASKVCGPF